MNLHYQQFFGFFKIKSDRIIPSIFNSRVVFYFVVCLLLIKIITAGFYFPFSSNLFFADVTRVDLLKLLNENRVSHGLAPLRENSALNQAAQLKAQDMIKNGYFSHFSPSGVSPWHWFSQAGYDYKYAGENLAIGFTDSKNVYDAWLASPTHKANLLNTFYQEVGYAVLSGFNGDNTVVVVQLFASPNTKIKTTPIAKTENNQQEPTVSNATQNSIVSLPTQDNQDKQVLAQNTNQLQEEEMKQEETKPTDTVTVKDLPVYKNSANQSSDKVAGYIIKANNITQYVLYLLLFIMIILLVITIATNKKLRQNPNFVLKSLVLIGVIYFATLVDKNMASQVIPHYVFL